MLAGLSIGAHFVKMCTNLTTAHRAVYSPLQDQPEILEEKEICTRKESCEL